MTNVCTRTMQYCYKYNLILEPSNMRMSISALKSKCNFFIDALILA